MPEAWILPFPAPVLLMIGGFLLFWSSDRFVEHAAHLARSLRVPPVVIGAMVIAYSNPKSVVASRTANRWLNIVWIIATWAVLQWAMGFAMGVEGTRVATAAHIGGFVAGMAAFWPLVKWKYRRA